MPRSPVYKGEDNPHTIQCPSGVERLTPFHPFFFYRLLIRVGVESVVRRKLISGSSKMIWG